MRLHRVVVAGDEEDEEEEQDEEEEETQELADDVAYGNDDDDDGNANDDDDEDTDEQGEDEDWIHAGILIRPCSTKHKNPFSSAFQALNATPRVASVCERLRIQQGCGLPVHVM